MINDALAGKINIIITKSVSRFARNTVDALVTIQKLRDKKVKVIFEKDGIDSDDPKCELILKIMASLAEEESRNLSTNIRWRNDKKFESGEVVMNFNSLLGYEQKDGVVTIVEEEAEVIREIFYKVLMGLSFSAIKQNLIERGIKTSLGNLTWHKSLISSICQNEKYLGDAILRKTYQRDLLKTLWTNVLEEVTNAFEHRRDKEAAEKVALLQSVYFEHRGRTGKKGKRNRKSGCRS